MVSAHKGWVNYLAKSKLWPDALPKDRLKARLRFLGVKATIGKAGERRTGGKHEPVAGL